MIVQRFGDAASIPTHDPWTFVNYDQREQIISSLAKQFKLGRNRAGQGELLAPSVITAPSELVKQNPSSLNLERMTWEKLQNPGRLKK